MSYVANGAAEYGTPRDYAELFTNYHGFVRQRVLRRGIEERNADDVTGDLLLRFMEKRSLEQYDPTLTFFKAGEYRTCSFKTYISRFVDAHVKGHRDKQNKMRRREPLICDVVVPGIGAIPTTWRDINEEKYGVSDDGHEDDVINMVVTEGLVGAMRNYLADIPPRSIYDKCDLVAVLDGVVEQILDKGVLDFEILAQRLGVAATSASKYFWRLRTHLCEATGRPVPRKRPRNTQKNSDPSR